MSTLPLFNYPTTVAWIDDDPSFLHGMTTLLNNCFTFKSFTSSRESLTYFQDYKSHLSGVSFFYGRNECDDYETINHLPIDINAKAFAQLPFQPERHDEISIIIVDFRMPEIDGIELCRKIKHIPAKKILLTGEANNSLAISAFNEGIIDRFLRKDSKTLLEDIKSGIEMLSKDYLIDQSKSLLSHLEIDTKLPLTDPDFILFFHDWCKANNIQEHYIFDKQCNLQVIDNKGIKKCFIVHTEQSLNNFSDTYQDNEEISEFIRSVNAREQVPFFGIGIEGWQRNPKDWSTYFQKPQTFTGREKYYWCVTQ